MWEPGLERSHRRLVRLDGTRAGWVAEDVCTRPGIGTGWDALRAPSWLRSEAPGRWDLRAGCCFLPALGKRRSGLGGERWRPRSALSGVGEESPARQALAWCRPAQPRNRKVHASCFNFSGPRHSPERGASAPTSGKEPGERPVGALLLQFFGGRRQPFHDLGGNYLWSPGSCP